MSKEWGRDELVFATMEDLRLSHEAYVAQNEATIKKLSDEIRSLYERISYLEIGGRN
jgi:hypothetical protein